MRKIGLGISQAEGASSITTDDLSAVDAYTTLIGGIKPASWSIWTSWGGLNNGFSGTYGNSLPDQTILNGLSSRGIKPMIFWEIVGSGSHRFDKHFTYDSLSTSGSGIASGRVRFNNVDPSLVTQIYIHKTSLVGSGNFTTWEVGKDVVLSPTRTIYHGTLENVGAFYLRITAITDNTTYFTFTVTAPETNARPATMFADSITLWAGVTLSSAAERYGNQSILDGYWDSYIDAFATRIASIDKIVIVRLNQEMNQTWFPWSMGQPLSRSGDGTFNYYNLAATPDNFILAWRHVYNRVIGIAPKARFLFCPIGTRNVVELYPGRDYVHYNGFDAYQWHPLTNTTSFVDQIRPIINRLKILGVADDGTLKPVIIGEWGIAGYDVQPITSPTDAIFLTKAEGEIADFTTDGYVLNSPDTETMAAPQQALIRRRWIKSALDGVYDFYPHVVGMVYFNINMFELGQAVDWRLQAKPGIVSAYKTRAILEKFQGNY